MQSTELRSRQSLLGQRPGSAPAPAARALSEGTRPPQLPLELLEPGPRSPSLRTGLCLRGPGTPLSAWPGCSWGMAARPPSPASGSAEPVSSLALVSRLLRLAAAVTAVRQPARGWGVARSWEGPTGPCGGGGGCGGQPEPSEAAWGRGGTVRCRGLCQGRWCLMAGVPHVAQQEAGGVIL